RRRVTGSVTYALRVELPGHPILVRKLWSRPLGLFLQNRGSGKRLGTCRAEDAVGRWNLVCVLLLMSCGDRGDTEGCAEVDQVKVFTDADGDGYGAGHPIAVCE